MQMQEQKLSFPSSVAFLQNKTSPNLNFILYWWEHNSHLAFIKSIFYETSHVFKHSSCINFMLPEQRQGDISFPVSYEKSVVSKQILQLISSSFFLSFIYYKLSYSF